MFRSQVEEASEFAKELREVKELLREISMRVTQIENRARKVFPNEFPRKSVTSRKSEKSELEMTPTLSSSEAQSTYEELVKLASAEDPEAVTKVLESMTLANLNFLGHELGLSLGKRKPSRKILNKGILGRLNESRMLSTTGLSGRRQEPRDESNHMVSDETDVGDRNR